MQGGGEAGEETSINQEAEEETHINPGEETRIDPGGGRDKHRSCVCEVELGRGEERRRRQLDSYDWRGNAAGNDLATRARCLRIETKAIKKEQKRARESHTAPTAGLPTSQPDKQTDRLTRRQQVAPALRRRSASNL